LGYEKALGQIHDMLLHTGRVLAKKRFSSRWRILELLKNCAICPAAIPKFRKFKSEVRRLFTECQPQSAGRSGTAWETSRADHAEIDGLHQRATLEFYGATNSISFDNQSVERITCRKIA